MCLTGNSIGAHLGIARLFTPQDDERDAVRRSSGTPAVDVGGEMIQSRS